MADVENDFQVVRNKKGKRRNKKHVSVTETSPNLEHEDADVDVESLKRRIQKCRDELLQSPFYAGLIKTLEQALQSAKTSCMDFNTSPDTQTSSESDDILCHDTKDTQMPTTKHATTVKQQCEMYTSQRLAPMHTDEKGCELTSPQRQTQTHAKISDMNSPQSQRDEKGCETNLLQRQTQIYKVESGINYSHRQTQTVAKRSGISYPPKQAQTVAKGPDMNFAPKQIMETETEIDLKGCELISPQRQTETELSSPRQTEAEIYSQRQTEMEGKTRRVEGCGDVTLVVYGLGNFVSCLIARYQLALVLNILHHLQIKPGQCVTYDPKYTQTEKRILMDLGCSLIEHNEEGKRRVEGVTVMVMPHCGKPLFNNLLWANWSPWQLQRLIIIGNSFSAILDSLPARLWEQHIGYIARISNNMCEASVINSFTHRDIFNDMSVHWFPATLLHQVHSHHWSHVQEPRYDSDDVEIILKS